MSVIHNKDIIRMAEVQHSFCPLWGRITVFARDKIWQKFQPIDGSYIVKQTMDNPDMEEVIDCCFIDMSAFLAYKDARRLNISRFFDQTTSLFMLFGTFHDLHKHPLSELVRIHNVPTILSIATRYRPYSPIPIVGIWDKDSDACTGLITL